MDSRAPLNRASESAGASVHTLGALIAALLTTLGAVAADLPAAPPWCGADGTHRALVRLGSGPEAATTRRPVVLAWPDQAPLAAAAVRAWDLRSGLEVPAQRVGSRVWLDPGIADPPGQERRFHLYACTAPSPLSAAARIEGSFRVETERYVAVLDPTQGGAITSLLLKDGERRTETLGDGIHWWVGRNPQILQKKLGAVACEVIAVGPVFAAVRVTVPDLLGPGNTLTTEIRFYREFMDIDHHFRVATPTQVEGLKLPVSLRATGSTPGLFSNSQATDTALLTAGKANRWYPDPTWHDVSYPGEAPYGLGVISRAASGGLYLMDSVRPDEHEWIYAEPFGWDKPVAVKADFEVNLTLVPHAAGPGRSADTRACLEVAGGARLGAFEARGAPPVDSDQDGLPDLAELERGTNPEAADTDQDGIPDGQDPEPLAGTPPRVGLTLPTLSARPTAQPQSVAEVKPVLGTPTLVIDGKPYGPMLYTRCAATLPQIAEIAGRNFPVHFEMVGGVGWPGAQLATFRRLDDQINRFLDQVPNARLILRLYVCNPPRFARDYPDETMAFNDGSPRHFTKWYAMTDRSPEERGYPSFASEVWRQKTVEALAEYVTHVRQAAYAPNVIGYFICGGGTEEWYYWGDYDHEKYAVDFSPPMLRAFRTHLRATYGGEVRALRAAWQDPSADFATALPPLPARRRTTDAGVFWDPERNRQVRDYYYVHNKVMEDSLLLFASAVKQACNRQQLVGMFHGYLQNHWLLEGGQATLKDLLASPDVDFWSGPPQYNRRGPGEHGCIRFPPASLRAHGKLWISESDIRTSFAEPAPDNPSLHGRPPDVQESLACLQREYAHQLCEGFTGWWFQMGREWYHQPPVLDLFERLQVCGEAAMGVDRTSDTDIASVVDLDSLFTGPPWPVTTALIDAFKVQELCRLGAPVDHYELADVLAPGARSYKLYIMLNCFRLTDAERRLINERLRRRGATLVWMFAPGLFNPDRAPEMSPEHSRELLGFGLEAETGSTRNLNMRLNDAGHDLFSGFAPERVFGSFERPEWVLDKGSGGVREQVPGPTTLRQRWTGGTDGTVLATFEDGGRPAIVSRTGPESTDIWIGSLMAPADLLRSLARRAGCHLYCDADEIIYANRSFLAIHTRTAGTRTFALRRSADVTEVFSGATLGQGVSSFEDRLDAFRTRLYFLGDRATWQQEMARAQTFFAAFQAELKAQRLVRAARPQVSATPPAEALDTAGPYPLNPEGFLTTVLLCAPFPSPGGGEATAGYAQDFINEASVRPALGLTRRAVFRAAVGSPEAGQWFDGKAGERVLENPWSALRVSTEIAMLKEQVPAVPFDQNIAYYVAAYVEPGEVRAAEIRLGSDDGFKLWFNGQLLGGANLSRSAGVDAERFPVTLNAGRNLILLKIIQGGGPTGWCLRLTDPAGQPLPGAKVWLTEP
jgi:hypothetical protein